MAGHTGMVAPARHNNPLVLEQHGSADKLAGGRTGGPAACAATAWRCFDWAHHAPAHFATAPDAVNWLVAGAAFLGGSCFVLGGFAGSATPILEQGASKRGLANQYDWLVTFTFFLGSYFFTVGCFLLSVQALNAGYETELQAWQAAGCKGAPPRFRWLGWMPRSLAWWAGVSYTFGALLYNIGTTTGLATSWPSVSLSKTAYDVLALYTFFIGGFCFFGSGLAYVIILQGPNFLPGISPFFILLHGCGALQAGAAARGPLQRGILVPLRWQQWASLDYWIDWFNFWGGAGFCMSGIFLLPHIYYSLTLRQYEIENAVGFGAGSVCFWTSGLLIYVKLSLARTSAARQEERAASQRRRAALHASLAQRDDSAADVV